MNWDVDTRAKLELEAGSTHLAESGATASHLDLPGLCPVQLRDSLGHRSSVENARALHARELRTVSGTGPTVWLYGGAASVGGGARADETRPVVEPTATRWSSCGSGDHASSSGGAGEVSLTNPHTCYLGILPRKRVQRTRNPRAPQIGRVSSWVVRCGACHVIPFFARRSVMADERDEARIYISEPLSHLCSMYYVRVRWGSAARFRPKATVG